MQRFFHYCRLMPAVVVLLCLLIAPLGVAHADTPPQLNFDAADAYLQSLVRDMRVPGIGFVVVQGDRTVFAKGYGESAGKQLTAQSQFYLGSVSKSLTAMAVMQLVEQGKLSLDAPVQQYLPWFGIADAQASAQITVRHLLNQTSGLSAEGDRGAEDYAPTLTEQVQGMADARLTAPVGSKFQYDNQNYRVLGLLIEQVTGQTYGDYLRERLFRPLGMTNTVTSPNDAPNLAPAYGQAFGLPVERTQAFHPAALPSGYIISTAEDMGHFLIALLNEGRYNGQQAVKPETLAQMYTPPAGIDSDYGMGWVTVTDTFSANPTKKEQIIYHDGNIENYNAIVMMFPERGWGFAILCNQSSLYELMTVHSYKPAIVASLLAGETPPVMPAFGWVNLVLAGLVVLTLIYNAFRFWQLPRRVARSMRWSSLRRRSWLALHLVAPLVVFFGFSPLASTLLNETTSWPLVLGLAPDVAGLVLLILGLSFVRAIVRVWLVTRRKSESIFTT
jgi:CubicO group peptidase (beta-lactamase class C family)